MFQERNKALLHPTNENEYFIDRDGKLFRYILQFYRRNKIVWPEPGKYIEFILFILFYSILFYLIFIFILFFKNNFFY
jgi:hypothetical protein